MEAHEPGASTRDTDDVLGNRGVDQPHDHHDIVPRARAVETVIRNDLGVSNRETEKERIENSVDG